MAQDPFDSPRSHAPRRKISPRVAAKNKWRRIEALARNKQWLADYREAMRQYNAGNRDAVFPYGTYLMHVRHHVPVSGTNYFAATAA